MAGKAMLIELVMRLLLAQLLRVWHMPLASSRPAKPLQSAAQRRCWLPAGDDTVG